MEYLSERYPADDFAGWAIPAGLAPLLAVGWRIIAVVPAEAHITRTAAYPEEGDRGSDWEVTELLVILGREDAA